jgi:hypothetical protein
MHSLPIAAEIALTYPDIEVHVAVATPDHVGEIQRMIEQHAPGAPLHYHVLGLGRLDGLRRHAGYLWKLAVLFRNRRYLDGFDAIVTPERTSLMSRHFGVTRPRLIWTRHGAGDRRVGFSRDVNRFDFVCMAGNKIEQRLLADKLIRPGCYVTGVYAKFDWNPQLNKRGSPFDNGRPTVLYAPHFRPRLSSWHKHGRGVLDWFVAHPEYNLIFAPHVRLFDPPTEVRYAEFEQWRGAPNLHIDLGSQRSVDMSYVASADIYLGDVSSQVAEFVRRPRPCLFIDSHAARWRDNPDYEFWSLGRVITSLDELGGALAQAEATLPLFEQRQRAYTADTFQLSGERSAPIAAHAIVRYLERVLQQPVTVLPVPARAKAA